MHRISPVDRRVARPAGEDRRVGQQALAPCPAHQLVDRHARLPGGQVVQRNVDAGEQLIARPRRPKTKSPGRSAARSPPSPADLADQQAGQAPHQKACEAGAAINARTTSGGPAHSPMPTRPSSSMSHTGGVCAVELQQQVRDRGCRPSARRCAASAGAERHRFGVQLDAQPRRGRQRHHAVDQLRLRRAPGACAAAGRRAAAPRT